MILAYRFSEDLDVIFEDGTIVKNRRFADFIHKQIRNPLFHQEHINKRIGASSIANNGQTMTIIAYRNCNDIDVQFEDGTVVCNKSYGCFVRHRIKNHNMILSNKQLSHIGETSTANNGCSMKIIAYRGRNDIDVQFEDGTIVCNKTYNNFKRGAIQNPNFVSKKHYLKNSGKKQLNRVGETAINKHGQKMTIIAYRKSKDIDIQFDDGTILVHKNYHAFSHGEILNPIYEKKQQESAKIGQTITATNGQKMTIIAYRGYKDIDVQFEDGTIVYNKTCGDFNKGQIGNHNFKNAFKEQRVGETNVADNGQEMTIVEYFTKRNITVQFEDGTIVKNKHYKSFQNGAIGNPNFANKISVLQYAQGKIGETAMATNGQTMTIINYVNSHNIDVQFSDGTIVKKKSYRSFLAGNIENPNKKIMKGTSVNEQSLLYYLMPYGFINGKRGTLSQFGLGKKEIDIFHPILKIGIEYDGYGHSDKKDLEKNKLCANAGIKLIRIRESYNTILTNKNSVNFYLADDKQISENLNDVFIDVCKYINNISSLNINTNLINFKKDKQKIYKHILKNVVVNRIGETNKAKNGQAMTIIAYRSAIDIDVQFEDGTIVTGRSYQNFKCGGIRNPNFKKNKSV